MRTNYLLPHRFKKIGWLLFIPAVIIGILFFANSWQPDFFETTVFGVYMDSNSGRNTIGFTENNVLDELICVLMTVGGLMVAFSKEKDEDELISSIRLSALAWATYFNYALLVLALLFGFDVFFFWFMIFNMFTILIFFIIKFNWSIRKLRKSVGYEE